MVSGALGRLGDEALIVCLKFGRVDKATEALQAWYGEDASTRVVGPAFG